VPAPVSESLLALFRRFLTEDPLPRGRTLERLGLGGLGARDLRDLFARGWESPLWEKVIR
jgi:hypothetical protein